MEERLGEETGRAHEAAAYPYWFARALRVCGDDDYARGYLALAVSLDDRLAATARADSAFNGWDQLDATLAEGLAKIRRGALR